MELFSNINVYAWFALVNLFSSIFFGLLIYFHDPKKRLYQAFLFLNLAMAVWSLGYFFWQISDTYNQALFWTRVLSIGSTLIPPTFLHWTLALLGLHRKRKKIIILFYIFSVIFILFGFSDIFIRTVESNTFFKFWPKPGILYSVYLFGTYAPIFLYSNYLIIKRYAESKGIERSRLRWVVIGSILSFLGGSTNFPLWYNIPIPPVANFLIALYPVFFSYSITRYRFMDIRSLVNRSITFGLLVSIISITFTAISVTIAAIFQGLVGTTSNIIAGLTVGVLVATAYQPLRQLIERVTNTFLYKKRYDPDQLLSEINEVTSSILNLNQLLESVCKSLVDAFHSNKIGIALANKEKPDKLEVAYQQDFADGSAEKLVNYKNAVKILRQEVKRLGGILVIDEMKTKYESGEFQPASVELLYALDQNDIALILPLFTKEKLVGLIAIGTKKSGDPYTQQDLNVLDIIAGQAGIAIENARLYEEQKQFAVTLQRRVDEATKELRAANDQLREMDRMKSDFISIASHQLRTPLTVIKGYISMMRGGSFGKVPAEIMRQLEKVYISNERLISLVENLLDISRIESGRQEYTFEKIQLEDLAQEVVNNLKKNAKTGFLSGID